MPASVLPVLGSALRRAEEYTCDRYGVACCQSEDDIKAAIAAMAAGDSRWKSINVDAYLKQIADTSGFWMSFNELTSDYPWLTKRMATSLALSKGEEVKHPRRHVFAWMLSCFIPRFGTGGAGSLLITVAIIGILAAVAIPAYQDYVERARFSSAYSSAQVITNKVTDYVISTNQWPESLQSLGYKNAELVDEANDIQIGIFNNGIVGAKVGVTESGEDEYIVLEPEVSEEGSVSWKCYGENLLIKHLPQPCL